MRGRSLFIMLGVVAALGVVLYMTMRPKAVPPVEPRPYVWLVDMGDLWRMSISLPSQGKSETWIKHEDQYWYFDKPQGPKVDMQRWGGGIPLILSGPGSNRRSSASASDAQLSIYGFGNPQMRITLAVKGGNTINIVVGDTTPDHHAYYIKQVGSREVFTVDSSWYDVLSRLVLDPPYPPPGQKQEE